MPWMVGRRLAEERARTLLAEEALHAAQARNEDTISLLMDREELLRQNHISERLRRGMMGRRRR